MWPLVVTQGMDIIIDPGCCRVRNQDMVLRSSLSQDATMMSPGGIIVHSDRHHPDYRVTLGPPHSLRWGFIPKAFT